MAALRAFPEELLEHILAETVVSSANPSARPPWHSPADTRTRLAPLLVSSQFHRIALPLFYHTVVLRSPKQSRALVAALKTQPSLARCVRRLILLAPSETDVETLALLRDAGARIRYLDITLPTEESGLPDALRALDGLEELVVRKGPATYLSQRGPRAVLEALADLISSCTKLESTTVSFPLSADPALSTLVGALAAAPSLHTLRTPVPSFWSPTLLAVSANPAMRRICLGDDLSGMGKPRSVMASSLFLSAARAHMRLSDLIRAGTSVIGWRTRAWTMGSVAAEPPSATRESACT
ncbi:hypothetical protein HMN09_00546400 [Mycena chlorophos]|uniref:Uncharacterized protein n=1 Tax=Mycena chlorophos TaxID=658473 RepID=A0A8H6TBV7_MYCCL|nr:hypothetical protein HMN09_00546400 [Mycena chlorophos]